ncbi:peptidase domain-containing ABC transporter [Duganella violaceipulchra]|nr:peptidase domain-containing ABC transporter [Duganella violaceicalia]MCP2008672.1 ATP-binding cassette subfamily B protein RaxB [Duganella violaceicalia]
MAVIKSLALRLRANRRTPLLLQTEATECGLACLGMVAGYYGYLADMTALRSRHGITLKGVTLTSLIRIAAQMNLSTRSVRAELHELDQLALPCILHWDFAHFVVLTKVSGSHVVIHDPAAGTRKLTLEEVSGYFTGVALELWPNAGFQIKEERSTVKLSSLMGRIDGLKRSLAQILLLAACLEVFSLVTPFFMQWLIDEVIVSGDRTLLVTMAIGFGLLMLVEQVFTFFRSWVITCMGTTVNLQWRANAFSHLIRLPVSYFEKRHLGDVVSRFGGIEQIQRTLTTSFVEAILDGVMTIVTLCMMFAFSKLLASISLLCTALYWLLRAIWYKPMRSANEESIIHGAKQQSHFLESIRGVKTVKLFQREEQRRSNWVNLVVDSMNAGIRIQKLQLLFRFLSGAITGGENIAVLWLGAIAILNGEFSVGALMAFNAYKSQFDVRIGSLTDKFLELKLLQVQGERLADIVHTEAEPHSLPSARMGEVSSAPSIKVSNLQFRYSEHEPLVLNDVSFEIRGGESVAIVGPSGCGKTTLLNLLLGLLSPTAGSIAVEGIDIKEFGVAGLRNIAGTVLQDDVLFAGTLAENISFFDAQPDHKWIAECACMAAIADEIEAMPMSYHTLVGDMGTVLSGGQKQRVLLARALYKRPRILFLDEATSHLDIRKEREVNTSVKRLDITRIIVAHRPETIAAAERVVELRPER